MSIERYRGYKTAEDKDFFMIAIHIQMKFQLKIQNLDRDADNLDDTHILNRLWWILMPGRCRN